MWIHRNKQHISISDVEKVTCNVCLLPLHSCMLAFLWGVLQVLQVDYTPFWCMWHVLLVTLMWLHPSYFKNRPSTLSLFQIRNTGPVEKWHLGSWDALPPEISAGQWFIQDEVKAPALWSLLQVFPKGSLVFYLQLLSVHGAKKVSSGRTVLQDAEDTIASSHGSALQDTEVRILVSLKSKTNS